MLGEGNSRDTLERGRSGKTSPSERLEALSLSHLGRSYAAKHARLQSQAPDPIPAPGDFSLGEFELEPFQFFPGESAATRNPCILHEYIGLVNYYWRVFFGKDS